MTFIGPIKFAIDLLAVLLLALGIKGLSKVRSAREANRLAAIAMLLAAFGVLMNSQGTIGISINSWVWIISGTLIGGLLGAITAQRILKKCLALLWVQEGVDSQP
jgi:NAD(P) transhydrogenase subunit beta